MFHNYHPGYVISHLLKNRRLALIMSSVMVLSALVTYLVLWTSLPLTLRYDATDVKVDGPLAITLNQLTHPIATDKVQVTPAVKGTWQYIQPDVTKNPKLVFTPATYLKAHTTYTVTIPNTKRIFGVELEVPKVSFTTERAPSLKSSGAASWKDGQVVAADETVRVDFVSPNRHLRKLELRTTPELETVSSVQRDQSYSWSPKNGVWPQNTDVTIELYDTKNEQSLLKKTIHIAAEPALTSPLGQANIDERESISLTFDQPINHQTAHIAFELPGKGTWKDDTTYVFTPDKLEPNKSYPYTVAKAMRSRDGGILQHDIAGSISTVGPITVVGTSPRGDGLAQASQTLSFTFSRPVDHASAEQRLSVSGGQVTGMSWRGNTLYATVANLGYQQTISATIAAGVKNTTFGVPSTRSFSLSFTTEVRSARLDIPFFRQQHAATCTAASLRMALAYRGVGADEIGLVNAMGYNPRSIDKSTDPPVWDDPQTMFVGSINGSITGGTGAGPDAPPVAKAARAYGRNASAVTGIDAGWIAQQLYNGNPVIMFGAFSRTGTITWKTPSGDTRIMNLTGHATTVTGVKGEPSNPIGFWVNDPLRGALYWTTAQVNANIALDPDRQAVVIY